MTEIKTTCESCDRNATTTAPTGLSGAPTENATALCEVHYAEWLFNQAGVDGLVGVGGGLFYVPVHLMPSPDGDRTFEVAANIPPKSTLGERLPEDYVKQLEYVEDELFAEVTGAHYDGDSPIGYIVVDADAATEYFQTWGVFAEHSVSGEATPKHGEST